MRKQITFYLIIFLITSSSTFGQKNRPQEPIEPYTYLTENISFKNITDNITLSGTLTLPKNGTIFSTVILISGSGPQDRDSEILGHKPFLVIANYLTKNGIAVLRVDDRGVGKSTGEYNNSSLDGFKRDTEYAIKYLKTRKEISSSKIGLIGHSLGGTLAPIIANNTKDINFIILLAGTGIRGDKLMLLQKEIIERKMGVNEIGISIGQKNIGGAYDIILKSTSGIDSLKIALKKHFTKVFGKALPENQISMISQQLSIPWLTDFIKYDPKDNLQKVTCSVLALNGANDLQVPAKENLTAIKNAIKGNGNNDVTTIEFPKLNHLFQKSKTGLPNEYGTIEQTFSPEVLKVMIDWILERVK